MKAKERLKVVALAVFVLFGGWITFVLAGIRQAWRDRNAAKPPVRPRYHARLFAEPTGETTVHGLAEWRAWGHVARADHRIQVPVDVKAEGPCTAMNIAFQRGTDAVDRHITAESAASAATIAQP